MRFYHNKKDIKGITLIALIVTIVILIILAGVSLYFIFSGNGLIEKAKWASFLSDFREIEECVEIYASDKMIDDIIDDATQTSSVQKVQMIAKNTNKANNQILPVGEKLTFEEKENIKKQKIELAVKIMQLSEKNVEDVNLYWIDQEKIGTNKKEHYIIDVDTRQIYQYEGQTIFGLKWHTLDGGVNSNTIGSLEDTEELWDGWIRLTLYYPINSTKRQWRLGEEGETRYDENLMWQDYVEPIWVRLSDVENVWIRYIINGEELVIAPNGRLAVDIQPDSYLPKLVNSVKVKIYYDSESELKEYKVGNSSWMEYTGEFIVTENTIIEARAKKTIQISDNEGNLVAEQETWGRDNVYIGNIGVEEADLLAPTIKRKEKDSNIEGEVAKVEITYPEGAQRKIYKKNYGIEENYSEELSITSYGTHIIAYYYNNEGKRSKSAQIFINEGTPESSGNYIPNSPGKPSSSGGSSGGSSSGGAPTTPSYTIPAPTISNSPSSVAENVQIRISPASGYAAESIYYKIGNGGYQKYTNAFTINYNTTITAYYITNKGERSSVARKRITNVKVPQMPYIALEANPDSYTQKYDAKEVMVTIKSEDADQVQYSLNGVIYLDYTSPLKITNNTRVYAKGINKNGETIEYIDITNIENGPNTIGKLSVSIDVNPEPKLTSELIDVAKVTINYDEKATNRLYRINNEELKVYEGPFEIKENCTIYAYAQNNNSVGQATKQIDHLKTGISKPEIVATPSNNKQTGVTTITINFDKSASIKRYKIGSGSYINYTGPIEVTENCTITAYNSNKLGYEATSSYIVNNIVKTTVITIDKGKYYIIKFNYPPQAVGKEYKWQDDGVWKSYKEDGIILIKPEYKNEFLNADGNIKVKIENEEGKLIDFNGDYYFLTGPISELIEHVYLRWSTMTPKTPTIILNTEEPTREVKVTINYSDILRVKQYKIVEPDGTTSGWKEYKEPFNITKKNIVIYARGQDETEMWSEEAIKKITNIDEDSPRINISADLENKLQKVGIKVEATDDTRVALVMWAEGIRQDSYFDNNGIVIPNNSIFYVTENKYYTIYAKDEVGNTSTYTLQVGNVDLTSPSIQITVKPDDTITTEVKIHIDYGDSVIKQYKIGENNTTWTSYTDDITLTSDTVLAKKWKNADNTVTVFAKGQDSAGNQKEVSYKILSLDIDEPKEPIIVSNYGYPILTEYGVEFDGQTTITYDTRDDIDNYYSIDNAQTWQKYTGPFNIVSTGTIMAKSVKKSSGLTKTTSITINMPSDAIGPAAYDGNTGTSAVVNYLTLGKLLVDSSMWGKGFYTRIYFYQNGTHQIQFINSNNQLISVGGSYYVTNNGFYTKDIQLTIPEGTSYIKMIPSAGYGYSYGSMTIYEIEPINEPKINVKQYYPVLTQYGVEQGYCEVTIDYFPTSVQRLYKIGEGEWQTYQNKPIRLKIGQTIYAKGIDKNNEETRIITSYTSTLPSDAIGPAAYDGNTGTSAVVNYPTLGKILVDSSMWGKGLYTRIYFYRNGTHQIQFMNSNDQVIPGGGSYGVTNNGFYTKDIQLTIPEGTSYIKMIPSAGYGYSYGSMTVYEINPLN